MKRKKVGTIKLGAPKRIPSHWKRQGYYLDPQVIYSVTVLSRVEGLSPSQFVNTVLDDCARRHSVRVPRLAK